MTPFVIVCIVTLLLLIGVQLFAEFRSLNGIKSRTVGDGQHGNARWATGGETRSYYRYIPFEPAKWRAQARVGSPPNLPQG